MSSRTFGRRTVIGGAAGLAATGALAACGSSSDTSAGSTTSSSPTKFDSIGGASVASSAAGGGLGKTSDVPVGGGKIYSDAQVVVTQPTAGTFKAFSAVCTHQGCIVSTISGSNITCPCHGSSFSITDGSVTNGPATQPLKSKTVSVSGDQLTLGT